MIRVLTATFIAISFPTVALADGWCVENGSDNGPNYVCPSNSDTCNHTTMTNESPHADTSGQTCHCQQWIVAPEGKYFKDPPVMTILSRTSERHTECAIIGSDGITHKRIPIGNSSITVTLVKKYAVRAHVETGSGAPAIGKTCHIHCNFTAEVVEITN